MDRSTCVLILAACLRIINYYKLVSQKPWKGISPNKINRKVDQHKEPGAQQKHWLHVKHAVSTLNRKTAMCELNQATEQFSRTFITGHGKHFNTPISSLVLLALVSTCITPSTNIQKKKCTAETAICRCSSK